MSLAWAVKLKGSPVSSEGEKGHRRGRVAEMGVQVRDRPVQKAQPAQVPRLKEMAQGGRLFFVPPPVRSPPARQRAYRAPRRRHS